MYISRRFETNICATIHLAALKELYNENLYIVDLRTEGKRKECDRRINLGAMSASEKILRTIQLNTWYLTNSRINTICNIIRKKNIKKIFIDESAFGKLVYRIKKKFPSVLVVTFYHDIGKMLYPQWLKINKAQNSDNDRINDLTDDKSPEYLICLYCNMNQQVGTFCREDRICCFLTLINKRLFAEQNIHRYDHSDYRMEQFHNQCI